MSTADSSRPLLEEIFLQIGFGKFHVLIIIIFGFIQFFASAEIVSSAFLGPSLICDWKISLLESSVVTLAVFVGMICGSLSFGKLSDAYGRKSIIIICVHGILFFGLLCSVSPNVVWVVGLRFVIGIFIGGYTTMLVTFLAEIMPINYRGIASLSVQMAWSLGSFYIALLTILLVPKFGWNLWLIVSILPIVLAIPLIIWLPESPRYLLLKNKPKEAIHVINRIAAMNNSKKISFAQIVEYKKPAFCDLFHRHYARTTIITAFISFISGNNFYGFILSSSIINDIPHKCLQNLNRTFNPSMYTKAPVDSSCCFNQSWDTMQTVFISIAGEVAFFLLGILVIKFMRRKLFLQILLAINAIVYGLLNLCLSSSNIGILMMFGRGAAAVMIGVNNLYVSEVFPTINRSFSIGFTNGFTRLGAIFSSFIVDILMVNHSFTGCTIYYFTINTVGFFCIFFLPYETKNRGLLQSVDEDISELQLISDKKR